MSDVLFVAVLTTSGLLAGGMVLVAAALVPTFRALPPANAVAVHQTIDRHINRYITPDTALTIALGAAIVALGSDTATRVLAAGGALLCVAVTLISVRRSVPLNRQIATWRTDDLPPEADDVRRRWARLHLVRTVAGMLALVAFAVAAVVAR